ncbi:serine/threonine-protein kinase Nek8 isoform X2 [Anopheles aquasalis]|uniref:serine/threonine-protein kinase Nek8 isoform X2 n=1 Tax=Anopheles aquasalis TaxID=42839 RepID=UPI00215B2496|nr:serine/threonine-protein kinase Nek8 isoform X2 [Anopheles aquasalis]
MSRLTLGEPRSNEPPAVGQQSGVEPEQRNHLEITGYRWMRIVGQGSFGVAILYERQSDGQQVVMKQVALGELTASEREMAMNEVDVFSKLHHPNIIAYLGSRVHGDRLFIEMEYADGGTLAQMLAQRAAGESLPERFVLNIFEQLVSAVAYLHSQNILHRDLKTANVFLHRKGTVKVGDFGISKITSTKVHAQTVLGTPYYFSPEMCEGKTYDVKSDIWALGCILGEMCCLKKAFTAANLSELVSKIMIAEYVPLPDSYSQSLRQVHALLFRIDPIARPSATEILQHWLPIVYRNLDSIEHRPLPTASDSNDKYAPTKASSTPTISRQRTVLYQLHSFGQSSSLAPLPLPSTLKIRQIATRGHHFVAVMEGTVYSWGEGDKGQLGHDALESWHHIPMRIEAVRQHTVIGAAVGQGFTVLWTQTGALLSCGDNSLGCLGHGNTTSLLVPQQIVKLERSAIVQVSCGTTHVLALTEAGIVYSWGTSSSGALALGKRLHTALEPERVLLPQTVQNVRELHAGPDCTILITREGDCYCCGSNAGNRLGLGRKVPETATLSKICIARGRPKILAVSVAETHAAFLVEGGYLVTLGDNRYGQRGVEHRSELLQSTIVRQLESRYIVSVQCSETYTVAITEDNCVVLWGTRMGTPDTAADGANIGNSLRTGHTRLKQQHDEECLAGYANSTAALTEILTTIYKQETIFTPSDVLAVYSSKEQQHLGSYVKLLEVHPLQHSLLVLIETNSPMV